MGSKHNGQISLLIQRQASSRQLEDFWEKGRKDKREQMCEIQRGRYEMLSLVGKTICAIYVWATKQNSPRKCILHNETIASSRKNSATLFEADPCLSTQFA